MRERELGVADAASSFFAGIVGELCEKDPSGSNTSSVSLPDAASSFVCGHSWRVV